MISRRIRLQLVVRAVPVHSTGAQRAELRSMTQVCSPQRTPSRPPTGRATGSFGMVWLYFSLSLRPQSPSRCEDFRRQPDLPHSLPGGNRRRTCWRNRTGHSGHICFGCSGRLLPRGVGWKPRLRFAADAWGSLVFIMGVCISKLAGVTRQANEELRQVLEAAPEAILEVAPDGEISLVNKTAERMFGYSRKEFLALNVTISFPATGAGTTCGIGSPIHSSQKGGPWPAASSWLLKEKTVPSSRSKSASAQTIPGEL